MINRIEYVSESLVVGRNHAIIAIIVTDNDAAKANGLNNEQLMATVEKSILALNAKLPQYSRIARCEFRTPIKSGEPSYFPLIKPTGV